MQTGALAAYEDALRDGGGRLGLRTCDGRDLPLDVARWLATADDADSSVIAKCTGPVLDIGCGPGRFVTALNARGIAVLGVDVARTAVLFTRESGNHALHRDVFAPLPGEGRWPTALLMDGNVGIGGDPARLLERVAALLVPGGRLLIETDADDAVHDVLTARFTMAGEVTGPSFPWARVGHDALCGYARASGYDVAASWSSGGRRFVELATRRSRSSRTA